jgi:hypothetical protein
LWITFINPVKETKVPLEGAFKTLPFIVQYVAIYPNKRPPIISNMKGGQTC